MTEIQLSFQFSEISHHTITAEQLAELLVRDLDFHDQNSGYLSHNFHSFPAKFPPQLPRLFINSLTKPGELVLDPMQGSGTTILEAMLANRRAIGLDIDPLALLITKVKTTPLDPIQVLGIAKDIQKKAYVTFTHRPNDLIEALESRWDQETKKFVDYWFETDTQFALMALLLEIDKLKNPALKNFFRLAFSSIIITKTGGVTLALDLAHTRPHRAKVVYSESGELLEGNDYKDKPVPNLKYATKTLRSCFDEFEKRVQNNVKGLLNHKDVDKPGHIFSGNAQDLPLLSESIDLIVTSPPYASNAIDYMRAHKFSLVWLGHSIQDLSIKRSEYIGGEVVTELVLENLPAFTTQIVSEITRLDPKKGRVLQRYYSEMARVLREMFRVLKPGKASIVVVGSSIMRNRDTETQNCLAEIGRSVGFEVPGIGVRNLDRNRRMLPAGQKVDQNSQIQKRMHEEFVIGFYKPN